MASRRRGLIITFLLVTISLSGFALFRSESPDRVMLAAIAAIEAGDLPRFDELQRELRKTDTHRSYAEFLAGVKALRLGSTNSALFRFSKLTPEGVLREPLLLYTAQALHQANRFPEAEAFLRALVTENPDNAEGHRWLGILYYDLGAYDASIVHLNKLSSLEPLDFRPYRLLGMMYRDFEQDQNAISAYQSALERNPPPGIRDEIAVELASSLVSQKRFKEAFALVDSLKDSASAELIKARCFLNSGQPEKAKECLDVAQRLAPDELRVLMLTAEFQQSQGHQLEAVETLRRAAAAFPFDAECRYQFSLALRDIGDQDSASKEIAEWTRLKAIAAKLSEQNFKALADAHDFVLREEIASLCDQLGKKELAEMWRKSAAALRTAEFAEEDEKEQRK